MTSIPTCIRYRYVQGCIAHSSDSVVTKPTSESVCKCGYHYYQTYNYLGCHGRNVFPLFWQVTNMMVRFRLQHLLPKPRKTRRCCPRTTRTVGWVSMDASVGCRQSVDSGEYIGLPTMHRKTLQRPIRFQTSLMCGVRALPPAAVIFCDFSTESSETSFTSQSRFRWSLTTTLLHLSLSLSLFVMVSAFGSSWSLGFTPSWPWSVQVSCKKTWLRNSRTAENKISSKQAR